MKVKLGNVRLSFPHLFKASKIEGTDGDPKFSGVFLLNKETQGDNIDGVEKAIKSAIEAKWGKKAPKAFKYKCFADGDDSDREEYEGHMVLTAKDTKRPVVIDRDKTPLAEEDGKPYGGCYVNAIVDVYALDNPFGKFILCSLKAVQFSKDGDSFGSAQIDVDAEFDDLGDDDDLL